MNSFVLVMFFVLQHQWIPINADNTLTPPNMPILGKSPCMYSGSFDPNGYYCPVVPMSVRSLPIECSSFIYDGLIYDEKLEINPSDSDIDNIDALRNSGKDVYVYYSHGSLQSWMLATDPSKVPIEASRLASFLHYNLVSGLILKDLNYNYDGNLDYHVDPNFNNNLKDYVIVMKQKNPDLKIGLYVNASNMIYYSSNPMSPDWFDFTVLNDVMDYYVIGFDKFNPCNELSRGIVPINTVCGFNNSLTSLATALDLSTIARDKIYVEFLANPTPNDSSDVLPVCAVTYQKLCEHSSYINMWCVDNLDSFYNKGVFAKQQLQVQGIITKYIDTIDPAAACECDSGNQFITFKMMLQGFSEQKIIIDCSKLNSIPAEEPSCTEDNTIVIEYAYIDYFYAYFYSQY